MKKFKMLLVMLFGKKNIIVMYTTKEVSDGTRHTFGQLYKYRGIWYDIEFTEIKPNEKD